LNRQGTSLWFTVLLGVLIALPALGTDLYVPALPGLAQALGAHADAAQLTLTTYFIGLAAGTVLHQRMAEVDAALALSTRNTPPLSWLLHSIQARYEPGIAGVERALMRGGPNSWIATLYSALNEIEGGHDRAIAIFQLARKRYLESIEAQVASLLGISSLKAIREAA
jgi:hypothetical protein